MLLQDPKVETALYISPPKQESTQIAGELKLLQTLVSDSGDGGHQKEGVPPPAGSFKIFCADFSIAFSGHMDRGLREREIREIS